MKKRIQILLLFTLLASCQERKLELKLINKEIVSKGFYIDTMETFYNYRVFKNENEKYHFTNVIKFELSNFTNKKYLFYIKSLNLSDIYNLNIIIEDENGNLLDQNKPLIDGLYSCKLASLIEQDFYIQREKELFLKKMGYNINSEILSFYNQEVIISPRENYIFQTSISLPFVIEDKDENFRKPIYYKLNPKKKYTFRLKYKLKDDIEKNIPNDILSNYKDNNIEIYKGEIESQRIPIVFN